MGVFTSPKRPDSRGVLYRICEVLQNTCLLTVVPLTLKMARITTRTQCTGDSGYIFRQIFFPPLAVRNTKTCTVYLLQIPEGNFFSIMLPLHSSGSLLCGFVFFLSTGDCLFRRKATGALPQPPCCFPVAGGICPQHPCRTALRGLPISLAAASCLCAPCALNDRKCGLTFSLLTLSSFSYYRLPRPYPGGTGLLFRRPRLPAAGISFLRRPLAGDQQCAGRGPACRFHLKLPGAFVRRFGGRPRHPHRVSCQLDLLQALSLRIPLKKISQMVLWA